MSDFVATPIPSSFFQTPAAAATGAATTSAKSELLAFTEVAGSPFTLNSTWKLVATVSANTLGLRLSAISVASNYDIEWCAVPAGSAAPTVLYGEPVSSGEAFPNSIPLGDIYLKSVSGQIAIVKLA